MTRGLFSRFSVAASAAASVVTSLVLLATVASTAPLAFAASPHRLMDSINAEMPIRLQSLHIIGDISGSTAETAVQMVFFNPNNRPLEGNLQFPLSAGQRITAFSLDINGQMRPAVPVEKAKGRQVFEEIERRRVDPALLEVTQGNNFKLRVFPVPAHGTRTVLLKYAEGLSRKAGDWAYQLPLDFDEDLQSFALDLYLHGSKVAPQLSGSLRDLQFDQNEDGYQAHFQKKQFTPHGSLKLQCAASSEAQTYIQERKGVNYFLAEIPVSSARTVRHLPKTIGLLWDSSGSGAKRAIAAELSTLDAYFKALGDGEVHLTRLRDRPEAMEKFKIVGGDWSALRKSLQDTVYDGASALADWKPEASVGDYLLFSDGLLNYGKKQFPTLAKSQRLYTLNSSASADTDRLAALAERTGGRFIQIDGQSIDSVDSAAKELLSEGSHVVDLDAIGASQLQIESADPADGILRIAGILQNPTATLHLNLLNNGKPQLINVDVNDSAAKHPLAAHFWASYRLHALEAEHDLKRAEIRRIGQEFGIPTSETSLIVLESVEDYVRYDITPPAEYLAAFTQMRDAHGVQLKQSRSAHLDQVVQQFKNKLAWWNTVFAKPAAIMLNQDGKPVANQRNNAQRNHDAQARYSESTGNANLIQEREEMAPPPMSLAQAAPMPANLAKSEKASGRVISTVVVAGIRKGIEAAISVRQNSSAVVEAIEAEDIGSAAPTYVAESLAREPGLSMKRSDNEASIPSAGMALKKWTSDAPYISRMKAATASQLYSIYLDEKPSYSNSSAFFLDAADMLIDKGQRDLALRVLSNLAEMDLENRQVLRILGYRLMELNAPDLAVPVFEKVQQLAEEEPQSFRDLGLALAAAKQYQAAIDQLNEVILRNWDGRFRDVEIITLAELNAIVANHRNLDTSRIDPRLLKNMPLAVRAVMTWDADNSDMDLWVTDPSGEKCYYGHQLTQQGGRMTADVTQGYGPEEFSLRVAQPGKYKVEANFYGNHQQAVAGATTLQVKLTTGFGTANAVDKMMTLRLKERGATVFVGEFEVKP